MNSEQVRAQIEAITSLLVEFSLCDEQNFPSVRRSGKYTHITIPNEPDLTIGIKNDIGYQKIYDRLDQTKSFNFRMLDGAIVQLLYKFKDADLDSHRLSYFPSPSLESFQNEPELYDKDEIYADILKKNIVPFPIRFDYSADDVKHIDIHHPKSHLTLGQYQNCRIPVFAPISPIVFIKFLLKNLYNTAYQSYESKINIPITFFPSCITYNEQDIPHFVLNRNIR